ncbi:DUF2141 domain-containing protein [Aquimarina sp. AD10]|uniref:DUF2141 domain-containing protein n=1 Tax=Aquimarina aggregata TaxID=1642818 RepID=A0A162XTE6_9FLAO|nr:MULTISPECIES: DUF2141 domain-containing protein [Aquimarina]AXT60327.1 DUF2141 domain-containing protein [Aquimarina sp. AD10]KZS38765.1 hypothetical protein AWE51_14355 [Aquimarina aggregata]RKN01239.1 DUF2141 domain-containing protein [Aquimarina sp. AD10]
MKTIALLIALMISNFILQAQEETKGITITVTVPNVTSSEGEVLFGLYDESTFLKAAPIQGEKSNIVDGVATITFKNVPKGVFAISCFHDKNGNNRMDFEDNGMPKENYGISNNNMSYGPPVWQEAKFEVNSENLEMEIRM